MKLMVGFAIACLWLAPAIGIAVGTTLGIANTQMAAWSAKAPWLLPAVFGLLACAAISIPASLKAGLRPAQLMIWVRFAGMSLLMAGIALPMLIGFVGRLDSNDRAEQLFPASVMLSQLISITSLGTLLFGAAVLALAPIFLVIEMRMNR